MIDGRNGNQITPYRISRLTGRKMMDILLPDLQNALFQFFIKITVCLLRETSHLVKAEIPLVGIISSDMVFQADLRRQLVSKRIQGILILAVRIKIRQIISKFHSAAFNIADEQPRRLQGTGRGSADGSGKPPVLYLTALQASHQAADILRRGTAHLAFYIGVINLRLIDIPGNTAHITFRVQGAVTVRGVAGTVTDKARLRRADDTARKALQSAGAVGSSQDASRILALQDHAVIGFSHDSADHAYAPHLPFAGAFPDHTVIRLPCKDRRLAVSVHLPVHHQVLNRGSVQASEQSGVVLRGIADLQVIDPVSLTIKVSLKRLRLRIPLVGKISNWQPGSGITQGNIPCQREIAALVSIHFLIGNAVRQQL